MSPERWRRKIAELVEFRIVSRKGDLMSLARFGDGAKITAKKCPHG